MKKILFVVFVFFGFLSCKNPVKKELVPLTFDKSEVDRKFFVFNDSTKPFVRLTLSFSYPVTFENDTVLDKLQKTFVYAFGGNDYVGRSPKGAIEAFEKDFEKDIASMSEGSTGDDLLWMNGCYQKVTTAFVDTTASVITIKTENESYMGGAHGSYNLRYFVADRKDGRILTEKDIFKNYSELEVTKLVLEALLAEYGERLEGVLFDRNDVRPNGNFYFDKKGLVYVYNEYEIAPYSEGLILVTIPYSKLAEVLLPAYQIK